MAWGDVTHVSLVRAGWEGGCSVSKLLVVIKRTKRRSESGTARGCRRCAEPALTIHLEPESATAPWGQN
jgi:hypothetical protein